MSAPEPDPPSHPGSPAAPFTGDAPTPTGAPVNPPSSGAGASYPPPTGPPPVGPPPIGPPPIGPAATPPPAGPSGRIRRNVIEWGVIIVVAVVAAFVLRGFVIQPYYIPSGSMEPTLRIGDKVLVNKLSYDLHAIHRGDVIVFKKPPNDYTPNIKDLIKRVIGLPGETISASGGSVYIDGRRLNEPWLPKGVTTEGLAQPVHIPAGEYFVMGDNRGDSADSRMIGPISKNLVVGRAFLIVWPLGHFGTL